MIISELDLDKFLTKKIYDPSPHRVDPDQESVTDRSQLPIIFECDTCLYKITLKISDFEKHTNSALSNLKDYDRNLIIEYLSQNKDHPESFIDFYCPKCNQPITIIYRGGPSGYWGMYEFEIKKILLKRNESLNQE